MRARHDLRGDGGRVLPDRVRVLRLQHGDVGVVCSTFHFTIVFSGGRATQCLS